jgi:hypothetical protein
MTIPDGHTCRQDLTNQIADEAPLSSRLPSEDVATMTTESRSHRGATADSLSRLLAQAVQSGDRSLLEEPLKVRREAVIRQTLRRLPVGLVVPLLKQLVRLLEMAPGRALELSLWLRHLLTQHSSYLMTQPQLVSLLSSFYQVLEVRSSVYSKLCRIHGKLDLMNIHEQHMADSSAELAEAVVSVTLGDEVASSGEDSEESDSEQSADDSDADSDVAMDTAEHLQQDLT